MRLELLQTKEMIDPSMYATKWILCLFTTGFPFQLCVRFWDIFLNEGWKMCFRLLLAIIKREKHELKKLSFEKILISFRDTPIRVGIDANRLISEAINIPLTTKQMKKAIAMAEANLISEEKEFERREEEYDAKSYDT